MVSIFFHKSKRDHLIKNRGDFKNVRESEKKILYFLKNKVNSILDIGCGTGLVYDWIKKNYTKCAYFGVDIDKNLVKYAQKKYNEKLFKNLNFFSIRKKFSDNQF